MVNLHRVISVQVLLFVEYMFAQKNTELHSLTNSNISKNYCSVTDESFISNRLDQRSISSNIFNLDRLNLESNQKSYSELLNNYKYIKPDLFEDCSILKDQNVYHSPIKGSISLNNNLGRKRVYIDNVRNNGVKEIISKESKINANRNYNKFDNSLQNLDKMNSEFRNKTQNMFDVCNYYITSELFDNDLSNNNAGDSLSISIKNKDLKRINSKHDKKHNTRNNNLTNSRLCNNDKMRYNLFYDVNCSNIKRCNGNENNNLIDSRHKVKRYCNFYTEVNSMNNASNSFKDLSLNNLLTNKKRHCLLSDKCEYDDGKSKGLMDGTYLESSIKSITQHNSAHLLDTNCTIYQSDGSYGNPVNNTYGFDGHFYNCRNNTPEECNDETNFKNNNNNIEYIQGTDSFDGINRCKSSKKFISKRKADNITELKEHGLQPKQSVHRTKHAYQSIFNKESALYKMAEKISQGYIEDFIKNSTNPWKANEFRDRILDNVLLRIIAGHTVSIESYPYMVTLHLRGQTICGGTIISESHVLTAGHCIVREVVDTEVYVRDPASLHIRAGTTYSDYGGIIRRVADVFPHPRYGAGFLYDLGIVLLQEPLELSDKIHIVSLAGPEETNILYRMMQEGHTCWVAGWGDVHPNLLSKPSPRRTRRSIDPSHLRIHYSNHLKAVKTRMITWQKCKEVQPWVHEDCMICTGHNDISGPCQRDSGSPLICSGLQYGIVSWGEGCGRPEEPDIFSRVDTSYAFIMETVNPPRYEQMAYPEAANNSDKTASFLNALMFLFIIFM